MGRIVELPSIKPRTTSPRRGLRKLSPDLISKARDETAAQVTRVGLTFLGTTAFCLLSLLSQDSALLGGSERINVPFAGPVSFLGFMLLGPAVLIALRLYLQIYVEHSDRLDRLARSVSVVRAPTLVPLQNSLIRLFSGLIFYMLLPVAMLLFAWKAAVFPAWGLGLFSVAVAVIASHVMLPFSRLSWRSKVLLSISAAIIAAGTMRGFGPPQRPFDLFRANLSGQWLVEHDLRKANLSHANLRDATLSRADLREANLRAANLRAANLIRTDLSGADLTWADLSGANLFSVNLSTANLSPANLSTAYLNQANLSAANLFERVNSCSVLPWRNRLAARASAKISSCLYPGRNRQFRGSMREPPHTLTRLHTLNYPVQRCDPDFIAMVMQGSLSDNNRELLATRVRPSLSYYLELWYNS
jgi:uncharacterized protein YjbI with pentapeptide repeats